MDRVKKIRRPVKASFTRCHKEVTEELDKDEKDLTVIHDRMKMMDENFKKLEVLDAKMIEAMVDEGESDQEVCKEQDKIDEYREKWIALQRRVEPILYPVQKSPAASEISLRTTRGQKKTYKLPKTEIRKFNGDVTDWLSWWAQFEKIHEDADLHESDKFQYLVQAMTEGSKAADLIKVFPQTAVNYPKAVLALKERFGKEKILKRVYVRELLKMIINNSRERTKISKIYDRLEAHLKALESLGITPDQMDVLLFPMVESCLPEDILMAWQRSSNYGRDGRLDNPPKTEFDYMMDFVKQEVENESQRAMAQAGFALTKETVRSQNPNQMRRMRGDQPTAASLYVKQENAGCIFCGRPNHLSKDCYSAVKMSIEDKNKKVRSSGCCFVCLRKGHLAFKCTSDVKCKQCQKKHVDLMCPGGVKKDDRQPSEEQKETEGTQNLSVTVPSDGSTRSAQSNVVLMKTLHVRVIGNNGKSMEVRLLFDEGSQRSYVKTSLARDLSCTVLRNLSLQNNLFGGQVTQVKQRQCYEVRLEGVEKSYRGMFELVNEDTICNGCPVVSKGPWLEELTRNNIRLSDTRRSSSEIQILIGSDLWGEFMTGRMFKMSCGMIAVESVFGWTLSGPLPTREMSCASTVITLLTSEKRSIEDLWNLETLGIRDSAEKISQEEHDYQVKKELQERTFRQEDGRYVVRLPWVSDSTEVPLNKKVAERRLATATAKLKKHGGFATYNKIFKDWELEGIIERVPSNEEEIGHFLPHRAVYKPDSLTTPVRPVFDASCKVGRHPSLNQSLEKGPNMLEMIPSILMRFRSKKIGILSDIRKAFLMIGVAQEDRNYQKFLWWESEGSQKPIELRHCRVVFGMNCSPFILAAVLDLHLSKVKEEDKEAAELLRRSLYVDNCVIALDT